METEVEKMEKQEVEAPQNQIPKEVLELNASFDKKASDDDNSVTDDTDTKKVEAKADEKIPVKETVKSEEEKLFDKEAEELEKKILADEAKTKEPEKKPAEEKQAEGDKYDCGLDPDVYDEDYIAAHNKIGQAFTDKIKALETEKDELKKAVEAFSAQKTADWLDRRFDSLGADFHEVLGEGDIDDIEPASKQFENRMAVVKRMNLVTQVYQKMNKPVPSRNKLFDMAVAYLYPKEKNKAKAQAETKEKLSARADQSLGGGSRKASQLSAQDKALKLQAEFDAKLDD